MAQRIHARKFLEALRDAGFINYDDHVTKVVIVADINDALRVYVERIGDERLIDVALGLFGVEVSGGPAAEVEVETTGKVTLVVDGEAVQPGSDEAAKAANV